jgi:uncharacterized damage-inducible protein DinB
VGAFHGTPLQIDFVPFPIAEPFATERLGGLRKAMADRSTSSESPMPDLDLLDRLLEHDAWTTRHVLDLCRELSDNQLDRDFDIGHRTVRETAAHLVGNIEVWTNLMTSQPVRPTPAPGSSISDLGARFEAAQARFGQAARRFRDERRLNELYSDVLDKPPRRKTIGATILHVLTHDHLHRGEILHMLERLGLRELPEGDVLSWESRGSG